LLNADKGSLSLRKHSLDMVTVNTWEEVVEFMKFITSKQFSSKGYDWVVVDSFSAIAQILTEHLESKGIGGFDFWGEYAKLIGGMMKTLRDSQVFNSLSIFELVEKENSSGLLEKKFGIQGSLASKVPYFYDFVFATKRIDKKGEKTKYALQTCHKDGYKDLKARGVELADYIPANIDNLMKKLQKE